MSQLETSSPILATRAAVVPASLDVEARTVEVTWTTGSDVVRRGLDGEQYIERLSMNPSHIRLDRLNQGAPVLDTHSSYTLDNVLGVVELASIRDGKGVAKIRFSDRPEVASRWADVRGGVLRNVSVGYMVHRWLIDQSGPVEIRTATDWEPYELSLVPIPADAGAQVRVFESETNDFQSRAPGSERNETMAVELETPEVAQRAQDTNIDTTKDVLAAERARVAQISSLCRTHGVESDRFIENGASLDTVRASILDTITERQKATQITSVQVGNVDRDASMKRDAVNALLHRAGEKVEGDGHRNFGDANLLDMARAVLESAGVNTRTLSRNEIAVRALSTSDFASILGLAGEKLVRAGYTEMPSSHRTAFRRGTLSDFKTANRPVSAAGTPLVKVPEGAEIPMDLAYAENSSIKLETFGKIIPITRQLIVNDDFSLVATISRDRGRAAAATERKTVWDLIKSNPNNTFSVGHANTASAAAGSTVDVDKLAAARKALRTAKAPDGTMIGASLSYVICGPNTETAWEKLLSSNYLPTSAAGVVPGSLRSVTVLVEPEITDDSWYGFSQYDTVEYAYLAGSEGPRLEQKIGFEIEGIALKVALDFGVAIIDYRGCYRQAQS